MSPSNKSQNIHFREKIQADDSITIRALRLATGLSHGTINNIIRYDLGLKKLSARWIPHFLTAEQKLKRVAVAKKILKDFGPNGQYRVTDIATGDETYIDLYCRPMKSKNRRWIKKKMPEETNFAPWFRNS